MQPILLYCYDAYCNWCYGFSTVMKQLVQKFESRVQIDVLSAGMIITQQPVPIANIATYLQNTYKIVTEATGAFYGEDYIWHIQNAHTSDWVLNSEKPAIALCIFKEYEPTMQVDFASDLQEALFKEGRDLCDDEAYRHLLEKYKINTKIFYNKLHSEDYKKKAYIEFEVCKKLRITGYPYMLLQTTPRTFHLLSAGYDTYSNLENKITNLLSIS